MGDVNEPLICGQPRSDGTFCGEALEIVSVARRMHKRLSRGFTRETVTMTQCPACGPRTIVDVVNVEHGLQESDRSTDTANHERRGTTHGNWTSKGVN